MKNFLASAAKLTSRGLIATVASVALFAAFPAAAGIANTKHNLGSTSKTGNNQTAATDELCVFCHTPHAADTDAPVPLWNKRLTTGASYTSYATLNTASLDGQILPVGSVSLACLSCHDGTQAMDNIINAPGSGGYLEGGGGAGGLGWTWTGSTVSSGKLTGLAMVGPDLSNDHPIGVAYCGGGLTTATAPSITDCKDKDFVVPSRDTINGNVSFWVNTDLTGSTGAREKTDMMLYTRRFGADPNANPPVLGADGPSVECGSCHDPHVESSATDGNSKAGATFLRIANTGSAVCLACHVK